LKRYSPTFWWFLPKNFGAVPLRQFSAKNPETNSYTEDGNFPISHLFWAAPRAASFFVKKEEGLSLPLWI